MPKMIRSTIRYCVVIVATLFAANLALSSLTSNALARESDRQVQQPAPAVQKKPKVQKKPEIKKAPAKTGTETSKRRTRKSTAKRTRTSTNRPFRPRETPVDGLPQDEAEDRFAVDQLIVRYQLNAPQAAMNALVGRLNLRHEEARTFQLAGVTLHLYTIVGGAPVRQVIAALQADQTVVTAQPNYLYGLAQTTASTANPAQYALVRLGIPDVHSVTRGAGVKVAVIDSGIDFSHPELAKSDHVELSVTGEDQPEPHKHGTSIAGIIAAKETLTGIAPEAPMIAIRAFDTTSDEQPSSTSWWIAKALDMAHGNGAGVVNMSFAGPPDPLIRDSVSGAAKRGMIAVAAAGNGGPDAAPLYPAAYENVIAVTAVDRDDALFGSANRGDYVALSAPGVDILVAAPGGNYDVSSGTSMAAAHVSGIVALMLSHKPDLKRDQIISILDSASTDLGEPGADPEFGQGLPNASSALDALGI